MKPVFVLALLLFTSIPARAGAGLDLIVLVDRSTSMARDRRLAPLFLRMTADLVARNATANRVDHRLAIISFGSSARIDVPLVSCRRESLALLRNRIAALPADDLGDTNVLAAFDAAKRLFDAAPPEPSRRRSILLLTDGVPFVRGADMEAYRAGLQRFIAANFKVQRTSIEVVLLDSRYRHMWRELATSVTVASGKPDELLGQAHGVIAGMVGTHTVEAAPAKTQSPVDVLIVPPYLEVIVFDVFRASGDASVMVFPPSSPTPIDDSQDGVESVRVGNVLATYVVPRPKPGQWIIRKSRPDSRVRIVSQQFFPRGVLSHPAATQPLRQYDPLALSYRLIDGDGRPLRELPSYPLSLVASVTKPDGASTVVTMERAPYLGLATFRSSRESECTLAGRYWTDVTVATNDDAGRRVEVFRDRWSGFSVLPAKRVDCRVETSGPVPGLSLTANIACFDANARPIDVRDFATGSPANLFRLALWRDGKAADAALDYEPVGPGAFRGRLRGTSRGGAYLLQLTADRAQLRPHYNVRFLPPQLTITRGGIPGWAAVAAVIAAVTAIAMVRARLTTKP